MTPFAISALVLIAAPLVAAVIALGFWLFSEPDEEALDEQHKSAMPYDSMHVSAEDREQRK